MKRLLYIVLFAVFLAACSQIPESSIDLPPNPPAPGGEQLYGRAIGDVGTVPSWASLIKYTTINKDLLQTGEKLVITTQKPGFYQGSQAQFVIYDKAYFYNAQSKTWTQLQASNTLSGQAAATNAPWKLDKGVFELTMDSRFADGKNFFLVYYCGRATQNGTWDCEGGKWKIGAFEYRPLRVNCGDGYIDPDEECERDSDCSSGEVCTSSCMCMTPQEQRAALLESQMVADNKNIGILIPPKIIVGEEDDTFVGIKNSAINPTGSEICFRTQIKCIGAPSGKYCDPSAQQNNIVVGGYSNIDSSQQVSSPWFADVEDLDVPNNELSVFLGSLETPEKFEEGLYQMRMTVFKHKDNKACGTSGFGTALQTEYAYLDFTMNVTLPAAPPPSNQTNATNQTALFCGDNMINGTEECDPPGNITNGVCTANCTITCNSGYAKSGNQCVPVQQNKEWNKVGSCTTHGWGGSTPQCPQMQCPQLPQGKMCTHPIGTQCQWALSEVYECQLQSTVTYTWLHKGQCTMGTGGTCPSGTTTCSAQTAQGSSCSQVGQFCQGGVYNPNDYYECVAQALGGGPTVPQDLRWLVQGVCSTPQCQGSMCAAACPPGDINENDLGESCSTKGEARKVDQGGNPDTYVLAQCGDVAGVTAYSWQEHLECSSSGSQGVRCPTLRCMGPTNVGSSCSLSNMDEFCYNDQGQTRYLAACKPTTMSQVQFAQPEFPITQVPAITGAVSLNDVANSKATQFAIVLIASLGIFIITLLNIVHKEK